VLETGEFIRVGSSKAQKTNVRVVAATNVNMLQAVQRGTFREDLYYRLNTIPIQVPPLRERKQDIHLLFRYFAQETAGRYKAPPLQLQDDALPLLNAYRWPGNVRQLRNLVEQMSVIEQQRDVNASTLRHYLPEEQSGLVPMGTAGGSGGGESINERELIFKFLFDMKSDLNALKEQVKALTGGQPLAGPMPPIYREELILPTTPGQGPMSIQLPGAVDEDVEHTEVEESLSIEAKERELIRKALLKHRNRRKNAAQELGISERTLYRKIKEYGIA
jgi:transcriptional regulator with PAS, ATPase and Fis domain